MKRKLKLCLYSLKYRLNMEQRNCLEAALSDLNEHKVTDAQSLKVKEALYDMGYMVEKYSLIVHPVMCC